MGVLPDWAIQRDVGITPFAEAIKRPGKISYGCGSYGYDMRVGYIFDVFSPINATEIDPKNFDKNCLVRKDLTGTDGQHLLIPPHSFALAESLEHFVIPRDTICIVIGKSTYARCGLVVNCTPLEPEWEGIVTLELSNTTPLPMRIYPGEGIAQCVFIRTDGYREEHEQHGATCAISYSDKGGKYQKQSGLTLPTVDKKE